MKSTVSMIKIAASIAVIGSSSLHSQVVVDQANFNSVATSAKLAGTTTPGGDYTWQNPDVGNPGAYGYFGTVYQGYGPDAYSYIEYVNSNTSTVGIGFAPQFTAGSSELIGVGFNTIAGNRLIGLSTPASGAGSFGVYAGIDGSGDYFWQVVGDGQILNNASGTTGNITATTVGFPDTLLMTYYANSGTYDLVVNNVAAITGGQFRNAAGDVFAPTESEVVAAGFQFAGSTDANDQVTSFKLTSTIPEPTTSAGILGMVGLLLALVSRKRLKA